MGIPVLVMGASGSGKSASLRNFQPNEVGIFNVAGKPLPFRNKLKICNGDDYELIKHVLRTNKSRTYVIDDSQYLMAFELLRKAMDKGYQKYTEIGVHMYELIDCITKQTTPDTIVYLLHHVEPLDDGTLKAKTAGKMIDNWLTFEGLFSIVLYCWTDRKKHVFFTQSDGRTTAKSPMGMFEYEIENDLKMVDKTIREYYNFTNNEEETK